MQRILQSILLLLPLLLLGGCKEKPKQEKVASISANDFAARYKLRELTPDSRGAYGFESGGKTLYFYPGLQVATYEGRVYSLLHAPWLEQDGLRIPKNIIGQLPQDFLKGLPAITGRMAVIIDPGHGGKDSGCQFNGLDEKDITLDVAQRMRGDMQKRNIDVQLSRDKDVFLTLEERSKIANANPGAIFVSVHVNANANTSAKGVETFYIADRISDSARGKKAANRYSIAGPGGKLSGNQELQAAMGLSIKYRRESEALAKLIQEELVMSSGQSNRGVKQENFAVLRESFFGPAVLVEIGFLSHPGTRKLLANPAYRQRLAEAVSQGIRRYMGTR